jgi:hypothetical protein
MMHTNETKSDQRERVDQRNGNGSRLQKLQRSIPGRPQLSMTAAVAAKSSSERQPNHQRQQQERCNPKKQQWPRKPPSSTGGKTSNVWHHVPKGPPPTKRRHSIVLERQRQLSPQQNSLPEHQQYNSDFPGHQVHQQQDQVDCTGPSHQYNDSFFYFPQFHYVPPPQLPHPSLFYPSSYPSMMIPPSDVDYSYPPATNMIDGTIFYNEHPYYQQRHTHDIYAPPPSGNHYNYPPLDAQYMYGVATSHHLQQHSIDPLVFHPRDEGYQQYQEGQNVEPSYPHISMNPSTVWFPRQENFEGEDDITDVTFN